MGLVMTRVSLLSLTVVSLLLCGPVMAGDGDVFPSLSIHDLSDLSADVYQDVGDLNGDGHVDIGMSVPDGFFVDDVQILLADGLGHLLPQPVLSMGYAIHQVTLADVSHDGILDLLLAVDVPGLSPLVTYFGVGDGRFSGNSFVLLPSAASDIDLADMDGDGDLDVAQAAQSGVNLAFNDGSGMLLNTITPDTSGSSCKGVVVADLDRDGLLDLAVANGLSLSNISVSSVSFLKGDGSGGFSPPVESYVTNGPLRLTGYDVNGDGALDLNVPGSTGWAEVLINGRGPWTALGEALAGELGLPKQVGEGTLIPGEPFVISLTDARPNSVTSLLAGLSALNAPFKGGVLVPALDLIATPLPTDDQGGAVVAGSWPSVPGGFALYLQFWHADPEGLNGFAASTALRANVP
ncbi:MAG: hypothetical protein ACI9EF_000186 [Pseudohongiellaceae bacterium]|jgi:hypothetical protein